MDRPPARPIEKIHDDLWRVEAPFPGAPVTENAAHALRAAAAAL